MINKKKIKEKMIIGLKIVEGIQDIYKKYNVSTSYCNNDVNQCANQTNENTDGFICEFYYGSPNKIYTPLGYLKIWSGGMLCDANCRAAEMEIKETFGLSLKQEAINDSMGTFGPWYFITKLPWDNTKIKCNCEEREFKKYIAYEDAKELYKQILSEIKGENYGHK
jgi:hypothetical protein